MAPKNQQNKENLQVKKVLKLNQDHRIQQRLINPRMLIIHHQMYHNQQNYYQIKIYKI